MMEENYRTGELLRWVYQSTSVARSPMKLFSKDPDDGIDAIWTESAGFVTILAQQRVAESWIFRYETLATLVLTASGELFWTFPDNLSRTVEP